MTWPGFDCCGPCVSGGARVARRRRSIILLSTFLTSIHNRSRGFAVAKGASVQITVDLNNPSDVGAARRDSAEILAGRSQCVRPLP